MLKCFMNYQKLQQCDVCDLMLCEFVEMDSKEENAQQSILRDFCADSLRLMVLQNTY